MSALQIVAALGFVAAVAGIVGDFNYADDLSAEADAKLARAEAIAAASDAAFILSHPLDYRAIVCQSGYGEPRRCRYYAPSPQR